MWGVFEEQFSRTLKLELFRGYCVHKAPVAVTVGVRCLWAKCSLSFLLREQRQRAQRELGLPAGPMARVPSCSGAMPAQLSMHPCVCHWKGVSSCGHWRVEGGQGCSKEGRTRSLNKIFCVSKTEHAALPLPFSTGWGPLSGTPWP